MTVLDIKNDFGLSFTVRLCRKGEPRFGFFRHPVHEGDEPLVEVYDPRYPAPPRLGEGNKRLPPGVPQWGDCELGLMFSVWPVGEFLALKGREEPLPLAKDCVP